MAFEAFHRLPISREQLAKVAGQARPFIDVATASAALGWDQTRTAKQMARWSNQGYLRRVRRGTYAVVPLASLAAERVIADPWVLVPTTFRSSYVGGWSAAEHWDLTEQIFNRLLICTTDRVRRSQLEVAGIALRARHVPVSWFFGTETVWRDGARVLVSDLHKTVIDMCADPAIGGGITHVM